MKQERNIKEDNFVKITSVEGIAEAEQLLRTLKKHGIEGYRQGGILNAYFGIPNAKEDIFVREIDMCCPAN